MILIQLSLQNFRSYKKTTFNFTKDLTFIIGPNTSGKTNLTEAIHVLSFGKSQRGEKDNETIRFGQDMGRIKGSVKSVNDSFTLEVILTRGTVGNIQTPFKKYLVNGVSKRRMDFSGKLPIVSFSPEDLDIIIGSPSLRRNFLNSILEQSDREYKKALVSYEKALRQRNALLERVKEEGRRDEKQFEYWDKILIGNGEFVAARRKEFIDFINKEKKEIFDFTCIYDKSLISKERLLQYKDAEVGAGVTLVGPHRDDVWIRMIAKEDESFNLKFFGSRGQQRLCILQLKLLNISYIENKLSERPLLVLDDIFSELDDSHIKHILKEIPSRQTIITTTHKEFIPKSILEKGEMIELEKEKLT